MAGEGLFILGLCCVLSAFNTVFYLMVTIVLIAMAAEALLKQDTDRQLTKPISDRSDAREKGRRLKEIVAASRFYEDTELTLATLALKLHIHPHDLSRMINQGLEKNFNDFINEFRVREIARKMRDPANDRLTLLGIAYDSGFNSERTFHRVFKEITNKTPLEYKNKLRKKLPIDKLATQQIKTFDGKTYTVAGVVKNYHYKPLTEKIGPQFFTMDTANSYGMVYIKIKPGTEKASLQYIAKTFKRLFPMNPFIYAFKQEQNEQSYATEARWKQIILFSAVLTIFISCIGLFGLSVLAVEKRVKEIGVRKVLGASVSSIVTMLSVDFLKLIFISLAISVPFAWIATSQWLQHYPYRILLGWWLFVLGGALVIIIALVTISFQSIKVAVTNPVKSLRSE
ncbi:helix-turn-helix domain-containing protein [Mucilaginibacter paludis]|nr:helix-turn-helix domain-containing protein [Mucilaginibacter paludis]